MVAIYKAMSKVMADIGKSGIGKDRVNEHQRYKFRGIDEVLNAINPLLVEAGIVLLPSYSGELVAKRGQTDKGKEVYAAEVTLSLSFVSTEDGSSCVVVTRGEASDSSDKATNKAMSAAFKYAMLQTFCIPTEERKDADADHIEVAAVPDAATPASAATRVAGIKKQIASATSLDDLQAIASLLEGEAESVRKECRQPYRERLVTIQSAEVSRG